MIVYRVLALSLDGLLDSAQVARIAETVAVGE